MNVLLVCTGNTCRSPMASEMLKDVSDENPKTRNLKIKSAGTFAAEDIPAANEAIQVMSERGLDIKKHRSKQFDEELADWADIILTMEAKHIEHIEAMTPSAEIKCHTLLGYIQGVEGYPGDGSFDISDPFGEPKEEYIECADILQAAVEKLCDIL